VVDHRAFHTGDRITDIARGQEAAAHGPFRVLEEQRHGGVAAGNTVYMGFAGITDPAVGRGYLGQRDLTRVDHMDADRRHALLRGDQTLFDRRWTGSRKDVAAALRIRHDRLIHEDL